MDKPSRPSVLGGLSVKVVTGCGNMYVQLNWYQGRLFEVFATLGKGGGCNVCQSEGLTRGITVGLKFGVPVSEYVRQLRWIRCPSPMPFPKEAAVESCPDAIARTLEEYGGLSMDRVVELLLGANGREDKGGVSVVDEETLVPAEVAERLKQLAQDREALELCEE